ncbi:golgin subfamily A member 6-like protein 7 [Procambarus clarkii]|uniref:golgin subfamily A member 6-like protein 7 n=1 Tax=Procambarus clarkii TaxID=6728 RepID=UPI0037420338
MKYPYIKHSGNPVNVDGAQERDAGAQEKDAGAQERDAGAQERVAGAQEKDAGAQERDADAQERDAEKDAGAQERDAGAQEKDAGAQEMDADAQERDVGAQERDVGAQERDVDLTAEQQKRQSTKRQAKGVKKHRPIQRCKAKDKEKVQNQSDNVRNSNVQNIDASSQSSRNNVRCLNCFYTNTRSLVNKSDALCTYKEAEKPDIIGICDTWGREGIIEG